MRDQIDSQLEKVFTTYKLRVDLFISSPLFAMIWTDFIMAHNESTSRFQFSVGRDVFKMALERALGGSKSLLDDRTFELISSYLPCTEELLTSYKSIQLIDIVNLTDFIEIEHLVGLFQQDKTMNVLHQLRNEKVII